MNLILMIKFGWWLLPLILSLASWIFCIFVATDRNTDAQGRAMGLFISLIFAIFVTVFSWGIYGIVCWIRD